jgi:putative ABC transport system permease protein
MTRSARALWRIALADLRHHLGQAIIVAVMIVAATGALTLALNVRRGTTDPWRRAFDAANGAHVTIFDPGGHGDALDPDRVATLPGVAAASGPYPELWNLSLVRDGHVYDADVEAVEDHDAARSVSRPLVTDGSWLGSEADGVVVERGFARRIGLRVGDRVQLSGVNGLLELRVVGLAVEPWRSPNENPLVFVRPSTFETLQPARSQWNASLYVRLTTPSADAEQALLRSLGDGRLGLRDWRDVEHGYLEWNNVYAVFLGVFSLFALLASGLIVSNLIAGRVLARYRDIGLLKAVGCTPRQVALVFLIEHGLIAAVGALLGMAAGFALSPLLLGRVTDALNSTATSVFDARLAAEVLLGIVILTLLFTALPAWRGGRVSAIHAIQHGFEPARARPALLARAATRLRLPAAVVFGAKDVFARRGRALLTVIALTLTVMTLVFSAGADSTVRNILDHPELSGEPFDVEVTSRPGWPNHLDKLLSKQSNVEYYYTRAFALATVPGQPTSARFIVRGLGGNWRAAQYVVRDGRMFSSPGEAIAGRQLLDDLNARVGDTVALEVNGQPLVVRIVGRYLDDDDGGRIMQVSDETLRAVAPDTAFDDYLIKLRDVSTARAFADQLQRDANYGVNIQVEHDGSTPPEATALRAITLGLSGVLLVIGLINLLATALLTVRERRRDFGIAKTLGLTPRQVVASVVTGAASLALLAVLVGVPLGLLNSWLLYKLVAERMLEAQPELYAAPGIGWLTLVAAGMLLIALLASALPARYAARTPPAEALRYS